jgi:hypothetical protein
LFIARAFVNLRDRNFKQWFASASACSANPTLLCRWRREEGLRGLSRFAYND